MAKGCCQYLCVLLSSSSVRQESRHRFTGPEAGIEDVWENTYIGITLTQTYNTDRYWGPIKMLLYLQLYGIGSIDNKT